MKSQRSYAKWLSRQTGNPKYDRAVRYFQRFHQAWPQWADDKAIRDIYKEARRRRALGEDVHVDHIVPLGHPHVCGLHVPDNLQIIDALANIRKGNNFWPDSWSETKSFEFKEEPHQLSLRV